MPKAPPKPCRRYGCPDMAVKDGFCEAHWTPRWQNYTKEPNFRDTAAWQKLRKAKLRRHPLCQCDDSGCKRMATVVHHIMPVEDGGYPWDWDNLQSMSRGCHERVHGRKNK